MRKLGQQAALLVFILPVGAQYAASAPAVLRTGKLSSIVSTSLDKPNLSWRSEAARMNAVYAPDTCVPQAYLDKVMILLERVVIREEGWINFGYGNSSGFNSLEQFRRTGALRIIPVTYMPVEQFQQYQPGDNLMHYCQWDTLQFYVLAYKRRKPIGHLRFRTDPDTANIAFSCGSVDGLRIKPFVHAYGKRLFLNETLGAYCVLTDGVLRVLNLRTGELQPVEVWMQEQGGVEAVKKQIHDYYTEG